MGVFLMSEDPPVETRCADKFSSGKGESDFSTADLLNPFLTKASSTVQPPLTKTKTVVQLDRLRVGWLDRRGTTRAHDAQETPTYRHNHQVY